ncbi:UNVERIFIED_CONTAM: Retrovirus-related Pol polyprotein from transposon TNT 1-94, partial [Sesamum latifolium]
LVAKGYTQRPGVDFEETYSPVAMAKSIRILLAIATCRRVSLLLEKNRKSVVSKGPSTASSKLPEAGTRVLISHTGYDFIKNDYDPCIYKKISGSSVAYLVLYVDDILLIGMMLRCLEEIQDGTLKTRTPSQRHGIKLSKKQSPKTDEELKRMSNIPYASAVGSIQYAVQCTRPMSLTL